MFRFTIRDVLWLTVVVALGTAWWAEKTFSSKYAHTLRERDLLRDFVNARGYTVELDEDVIWVKHPNAEYKLEHKSQNGRMFEQPYNARR